VGNDGSGSDSVQCHTDLSTCCSGTEGSHRGDWYFPDETRLPFSRTMLTHQLVSITVIFQLMLSMVIMTSQ
ncbi:hypothetical protein GBAR_LOCUS25838, partial [Geodia barretti]